MARPVVRPAKSWIASAEGLQSLLDRSGAEEHSRADGGVVYTLADGRALLAAPLGRGQYQAEVYGSVEECGCGS